VKKGLLSILLVFFLWSTFFHRGFAKMLSPDEALPLLQRMVEKVTHQNYWGAWEVDDYSRKEHRFYEVLFVKDIGFAWKELGARDFLNVKVGNYRYVFNLMSGEREGVFPFYELPFLPFEKDDLDLVLKNYLVYFQDNRISFFSRHNGEIVRSLTLDEDGFPVAQITYTPGGKAENTGRFVYLDFSPDYRCLASYLELMEQCAPEGREELSVVERKRIFFPRLLPPGFQLKRTYVVKSEGKKFYHLIYSDGLRYFTISQSVYPREFPRSFDFRLVFSEQKGGENFVIVGEKEGFSLSFMGSFDVETGAQVLESLEREGGR
jgi:hypothetical protein